VLPPNLPFYTSSPVPPPCIPTQALGFLAQTLARHYNLARLTALRASFVLATALATLACLLVLVSEFPDPSQASPYLVLTAKASLTKLPDPSQASPTSHQQPRHLDKAAKPTVSRYISWSKFPPQKNTLYLRVFLSPFSLILVAMG
jgi:hypothetical protein